jgi:hypothetical protein
MWMLVSFVCPIALASWVLLASAPPAATDGAGRAAGPARVSSGAVPGASLTPTRVRHYRMSGRIRPLLIWMGKDNVGLGRIVWRQGEGGRRGYELLIGTDPANAPRALNRWGFVSEQMEAGGGDLLALMTGALVASFAEAKEDTSNARQAGRIRALRGHLDDGLAAGQVVQVTLDRAPTVHDLAEVLHRLGYAPVSGVPVSARITPAARPGLLTAIADTLDRVVTTARDPGAPLGVLVGPAVPYAFGRDAYELRVRRAKRIDARRDGPATARAVEAEFEILTLATGARTRFELTTGLDGDLAGVPLSVRWQPRWWLEIGLHLTG